MSATSEVTTTFVPMEALTNMQAKDEMLRRCMEREQNKVENMENQIKRLKLKLQMAYFMALHTNAEIKAFAEQYHPYHIHIKPMAEMQKLLLDDSSDLIVISDENQYYLVDKINEFERKLRKAHAETIQKKKGAVAAADDAPPTMGARPGYTGKRARH